MKIFRSQFGKNERPEQVSFWAPRGTKTILKQMTGDIATSEKRPTQVSDTINSILLSNRDYARTMRAVTKGTYDTSKETSITSSEEDHS